MNTGEPQPLCMGAVMSGMCRAEEKGEMWEKMTVEGRGESGCQPSTANGHTKEHLFRGYQINFKAGDPVLTMDLPGHRMWKKRIWPRRSYPTKLFRWSTVEEILSYLISYDHHNSWISSEVPDKPPSGTILFFDRTQTKKYRNDGYDWKTRRLAKNSIREDRMKLKVGGFQLLYACYTHSASNPDFHRRSYWLIQNPNLIMVHYLEVESTCYDSYYTPPPVLEEDPAEVKCYVIPDNYNLLTISDCNLCALLNLVNSHEEAQALLKQLSLVLGQNLEKASTLEDAIAMNNTGLPFDKFEETRSKKQRSKVIISKKETPVAVENDPDAAPSGSGTNAEEDSPEKIISSTADSNPTNCLEVLKVLSASPHIIFCCPKDGPMSYVLLGNPGAKGFSSTSLPKKGGQVDDCEAPLPAGNNTAEVSTSKQPDSVVSAQMAGERGGKGVFGLKGATMSGGQLQRLPDVLSQLQNLIKPVDEEPPSSSSSSSRPMDQTSPSCGTLSSSRDQTITTPNPFLRTIGSTGKKSSKSGAKVEDYDPTKFSAFASSLVGMDPLKGFSRAASQGHRAATTLGGVSNGSEANRGGGLDMGMDLSASEDTPGVPKVPNVRLSPLNTSHTRVEDDVTQNMATISDRSGSGIQGVQNGTCSSESVSNGSDALLDMPLHLDSDSLQNLFLMSELPAESAPLEAVGGHTMTVNLSRLIENLTRNRFDLESGLNQESNPNQNGVVDQNAHKESFSYSYDTSSHVPHLSSHSSTSFSVPESSHAFSFSVPSPNIAAASMDDPHHGALSSTSDPNMWNSWQHCNADSIRMWLQSTSVAETDESTATPTNFSATPMDASLGNSTLPCMLPNPPSIELPQEVEDLVLNSDLCGSNAIPVQSYSRPATGTGTSMDDLLADQDIDSIMNWTRTSHVDDTVGLAAEMDLPNPSLVLDLLHPTSGSGGTAQRKDSNSSQYTASALSSFSDHSGHARSSSNASLEDWTRNSSYSQNLSLEQSASTGNHLSLPPFQPPQQYHRFSLPEMNFDVRTMDQSNTCFASSASHSPLQDIPEGVQMEVHSSMPSIHLQGSSLDFDHLYNYRTGSPIPSSPSVASTSSPSTVHERLFDSGESPSVIELCEMLGGTSNVHHRDFSHLTLTDSEQQQLLHAAQIIQNAFRKYKNRRQMRAREKHAALLIENYYKRYKEQKQQREQAAKRIQQHYRTYRSRSRNRELDRAALFIQQMYRYHRTKRSSQ